MTRAATEVLLAVLGLSRQHSRYKQLIPRVSLPKQTTAQSASSVVVHRAPRLGVSGKTTAYEEVYYRFDTCVVFSERRKRSQGER